MGKAIITSFVLGLTFGLGPCVASCGPLLISYTAAMNKNVKKSAYVYLLFSLSRILIYICVSLLIFLFGHAIINYSLASYSKYIFISGGLFIVIIGILIALGKNEEHRFCQRLQGFFLNKDAKTVVLLGLIVGILPCAPLISVLVYIGLVARTWFYALLCGLSFGLGTAISPLFILTIFSGFITKAFIDKNNFYRIFNLAFGLIIVFLGIRLISRSFK